MEFDELLTQFRSLGGVAENLTLRHGARGRGLFAIDPKRPVRVHVPTPLLVSPQWLALDKSQQLTVAPRFRGLLSAEALEFFERYQRFFGWGLGGLEAIRQHQLRLQALPAALKNFLEILGGAQELQQTLTPEGCLQKYCVNRQISVRSESRLMPIAEMINHDANGLAYVLDGGVQVCGMAQDEVLTRYHRHLDAFHFFFNYHFVTPAETALSCEVTVEVPGAGTFRILRSDHLASVVGGVRRPNICQQGDITELSFVEIANRSAPSQPRHTFAQLLATRKVPNRVAHTLFDGLIEHNQQVMTDLVHACRRHPGATASSLEAIAGHQMVLMA